MAAASAERALSRDVRAHRLRLTSRADPDADYRQHVRPAAGRPTGAGADGRPDRAGAYPHRQPRPPCVLPARMRIALSPGCARRRGTGRPRGDRSQRSLRPRQRPPVRLGNSGRRSRASSRAPVRPSLRITARSMSCSRPITNWRLVPSAYGAGAPSAGYRRHGLRHRWKMRAERGDHHFGRG
jgi:hypothetical protein